MTLFFSRWLAAATIFVELEVPYQSSALDRSPISARALGFIAHGTEYIQQGRRGMGILNLDMQLMGLISVPLLWRKFGPFAISYSGLCLQECSSRISSAQMD